MKILFPKEITTKKEKLDFLVKNKKFLVAQKKAAIKQCDTFGESHIEKRIAQDIIDKAALSVQDNEGEKSVTVIANTYYWMDSHGDVHIPGIFTKSISENQSTIPHLHDHCYELAAKVGVPTKIYETSMPWSNLGINIGGDTMVLLMDSIVKESYNACIYDQYNTKQITQHSVGMQYVDMFLCINDPEYKEYFANWNKYSKNIGNLPKAIEEGFFWAITTAKLKEISCVFKGSNELTGVLEEINEGGDDEDYDDNESSDPQGNKNKKPIDVTSKNKKESDKSTQKKVYNPNCY